MQARQQRIDRMLRAASGSTLVQNNVHAGGGYVQPLLPLPRVGGGVYRSSPGAVNGRGAPFLSSGFQAHPATPLTEGAFRSIPARPCVEQAFQVSLSGHALS